MAGTVPSIFNPTPPGGQLVVLEAGLPQGSAPGASPTAAGWSFTIQALDGVGSLSVGGYQAISNGLFTPGYVDLSYGRLGVNAYDPATGQVSVFFSLAGPIQNYPGLTMRYGDIFSAPVVLVDADGDQATTDLLVQVRDDDRVLANPDDATAVLGGPAAIGNVTANDLFSADGFGAVSRVADATHTTMVGVPATGAAALQGLYGTLTINASGAFSYAPSAGAAPGAVDHFDYWTTDGDLDQAQGSLTITLTASSSSAPTEGTAGPDTFHGGDGPDTLNGRAGDDMLDGGAGDDSIQDLAGDNTISGGAGNDTIQVASPTGGLLRGDDGNDSISTSLGAGNNTLEGGAGDDYLAAGPGADLLIGGPGNDLLAGGGGGDTFVFDWREAATPAAAAPFRNGQHPSIHANARAWEEYDRQAADEHFTVPVASLDGHTLWAKADGAGVTYQNPSGIDLIGGFNFAQGDRIDIRGVTDLAAFKSAVAAVTSAEFGAQAYDLQIGGVTFLTVYPEVGGTPFSPDWLV